LQELDYNFPTGLAIGNGNIYVAGHYKNNDVWNPSYWKNGEAIAMPTNSSKTFTSDITVFDTSVYITGRTVDDTNPVTIKGKLWVDGVEELLNTPNGFNSFPNALSVSHDNIFIGGWIKETDGKTIAASWKNGVLTRLTDGTKNAIIKDVIIVGSDTYAAGYTTNNNWTGTVWKNGTILHTFSNPEYTTQVQSIYVEGDIVYTLSTTFNIDSSGTRTETIQYHKNGIYQKELATSNIRVNAGGISVIDGDVYCLISYINNQDINVPQFYKNGELLDNLDSYLGDFIFDMIIK
jgi:hypothetical protein